MSLFFLHPVYLFGLIAAGLPVVIHLLNRRRLKRIRFPAVRFILLSQRRIARRYRLRHWVLLALRTFAVLVLVLLLAHPIFQTGVGLLAGGGPLSVVVVLDNSLSMTWSAGGEGFKQAKEAGRLLLSSLKEGDRASVVPANPAEGTEVRLKGEREILLRDLDGIHLGAGTADFSQALNRAYELLREPAPQKEIWLLTDMGITGWDRFALSALGQYDPLIPVKIIKVGESREPVNATIKEVKVHGREVAVDVPVRLEVSVVNFSDHEIKDLLVQLSLDDETREQRLISLRPGAESKVDFHLRIGRPGSHHGQVTLKKEGLAGNQNFYFAIRARDKIKILVVDGDPQTALIHSETFFLSRALDPSDGRDSSLFLPTVIIPESLHSVALDSYDAVVLCNVAAIPDAVAGRLGEYLRKGGGLIIFLGDRVQAGDYNQKLYDGGLSILPGRLGDKQLFPTGQGEKVERIDSNHPGLEGLGDRLLQASLQSTRIRGYFRVDPAPAANLLSLSGGDPLLVEKKIGRGRVLLFTTGADLDWSDLPFKTAYLPLIQSLAGYVSGEGSGALDSGIAVGETKKIRFPASYAGKSVRFVKPDRKEREVALVPDGDAVAAPFQGNDLVGIYRVLAAGASPPGAAELYPVNSPFLESRLDVMDEQELREKFQPIRPEIVPIEALAEGGRRLDLSLPLLVLLIITLLSEAWLAQRIYG